MTLVDLVNGFVPAGTEVDGPTELEAVLRHWLTESEKSTLGDVGAFGGSAIMTVEWGVDEFVLNRDTKRNAVEAFVTAAAAGGADKLSWHVTANRRGRINRVTYREDDGPTPGWYAYLLKPVGRPRKRVPLTTRSAPTVSRRETPRPEEFGPGRISVESPGTPQHAFVVQFPHPGAEHRPAGSMMPWHDGPHARKFMLAEATFGDERSSKHRGPVTFWGEWEAPSRVVAKWPKKGSLPRFLHEPVLEPPPEDLRQNTDPFVFGEAFYYSNCKQRTNHGRSATAMQGLTPRSLILFGSTIAGEFVLDTAFVVGSRLATLVAGEPLEIEVNDAFRTATLESLICRAPEEEMADGWSFTLYEGATPSQPVHGLFSFVPCLPQEGNDSRFARPAIHLPGMVNPRNRKAAKGATSPRPPDEVITTWKSVASQVLKQGLLLATQIRLPHK